MVQAGAVETTELASTGRAAVLVPRPVREHPEPVPTEPVVVAAPPLPPEPERGGWLTSLLPALSSLGILGFAFMNGSLLYILLGAGMAVLGVGASIGMRVSQARHSRQRHERMRTRYGQHLDERHERLVALVALQRQAASRVHPSPLCWRRAVQTLALWERRPHDNDYLHVRLGLGRAPLAAQLQLESNGPLADADEDLRYQAEQLVALHAVVDDVPLALDLSRISSVVVVGEPMQTKPLLRAALLSLALAHAPDDVRIAVLGDESEAGWARLLPHAELVTTDSSELCTFLDSEVRTRREQACRPDSTDRTLRKTACSALVVLVELAGLEATALRQFDDGLRDAAEIGIHLLLGGRTAADVPAGAAAMLAFDGDGSLWLREARPEAPSLVVARPDALELPKARQAAQALAPLRASAEAEGRSRAHTVLLSELIPDQSGTTGGWLDAEPANLLRVPIGLDDDGQPLILDLKESAAGGSGPHGLLVGATGSGKSELLRSLITALALTHPPEQLSFVCLDFKGGAAFNDLVELPQMAGLVTNLEDEPELVPRAATALAAELERRQRLFRQAGVDSLRRYRTERTSPSGELPPVPSLLVVIDEFSELLAAHPELLDVLLTIGRVGRSLGVHLLLASQRLDEGRLRGLESHLRFRFCLRTFSRAESQAVLGDGSAFYLPPSPGAGILAVDGGAARFTAALADDVAPAVQRIRKAAAHESTPPRQPVWLPPLPPALPLDTVLGTDLRQLQYPVGLLDLPERQAQRPLLLDLTGAGGNLAVVGAPQTGKSMLLRTAIASIATCSSPREVQLYAVDLGGGTLHALAGLPHVGTVCGGGDHGLARRLVAEVADMLSERLDLFRRFGIDGPATWRQLRGDGEVPPDRFGDVVLVIDGWAAFRARFEDLEATVVDIAATGTHVGVHVLLSTGRWSDLRSGLRESFATRWELRLNDPYESEHKRDVAVRLSTAPPGRLLTGEGQFAQVALPRLDGVADNNGLARTQATLVAEAVRRGGPAAAPVRSLPSNVPLPTISSPANQGVVLGIGERNLAPVAVDVLDGAGHLLVVGDGGSGRTSVLRTVLAQLRRPGVAVTLVDPRRTLLDESEGLAGYAYTPVGATAELERLAGRLRSRLPAEGLTTEQLRHGVHWCGEHHVVVIDDYELLATSGLSIGGPLTSLVDLLPLGPDVGLSVVAARRAAGSARGAFEPGWQALIELGTPGLLLSGDPAEGPLLGGIRARPQQPGRGILVRRSHPIELIQVALVDPTPVGANHTSSAPVHRI